MPLQGQLDGILSGLARIGVTKSNDLKDGWDWEGAHLAIQLQDDGVRRRLCAESLIMEKIHALGREPMLPCMDYVFD